MRAFTLAIALAGCGSPKPGPELAPLPPDQPRVDAGAAAAPEARTTLVEPGDPAAARALRYRFTAGALDTVEVTLDARAGDVVLDQTRLAWRREIVEVDAAGTASARFVMTAPADKGIELDVAISDRGAVELREARGITAELADQLVPRLELLPVEPVGAGAIWDADAELSRAASIRSALRYTLVGLDGDRASVEATGTLAGGNATATVDGTITLAVQLDLARGLGVGTVREQRTIVMGGQTTQSEQTMELRAP